MEAAGYTLESASPPLGTVRENDTRVASSITSTINGQNKTIDSLVLCRRDATIARRWKVRANAYSKVS